jgi:7-cyano-7-deazaguanine synthase in queuosine biosynthesis
MSNKLENRDMDINNSNVLLMFSGGLDSTAALLTLLQDKENIVHLHHLRLVNQENRIKAEDIAVDIIVEHISKIKPITYSESYHEYPSYNNSFIWDSDLYNFIAGTICMSLPNIKSVAIGRTKTDYGIEERSIRGTSILKLLAPNVEKIYPVGHLTKAEIYNTIPEELRNMTWSCRTPIKISNGMFKECGKCKTCLEISKIKDQK